MEFIQHKYVDVGGLNIHVAEIGKGDEVVVFLHGFPEIWYSWRYQLVAMANAGFRAIAIDYRGYGLSDQPPQPEKTTFRDFVDDLLKLLDVYNIPKVFLVGKDFGSRIAYHFTLLYPSRVAAVITLNLPFLLVGPEAFNIGLPDGFYALRWVEPGRAEKDFGRFDVKTVVKKIYILFSGNELPVAGKDQEILDLVDSSAALPSWFSEEDLQQFATLYQKNGFTTALQVPYRAWTEDYGVKELKVEVPGMLIMGEKDYILKSPGLEDFVRSGAVKKFVPDLEMKFIPEGTHFVQEQFPDLISRLILDFINKHL